MHHPPPISPDRILPSWKAADELCMVLLVLKDIFRVLWLAWFCLPFWLLLPLQDKPMQGLAGPRWPASAPLASTCCTCFLLSRPTLGSWAPLALTQYCWACWDPCCLVNSEKISVLMVSASSTPNCLLCHTLRGLGWLCEPPRVQQAC